MKDMEEDIMREHIWPLMAWKEIRSVEQCSVKVMHYDCKCQSKINCRLPCCQVARFPIKMTKFLCASKTDQK